MVELRSVSLQKANSALRAGHYEKAVSLYVDLLKAYPELSNSISFNLSVARKKLGSLESKGFFRNKEVLNINKDIRTSEIKSTTIHDIASSIKSSLKKDELISFDIWDTVLRRICDPDEIKLRAARTLWLINPLGDKSSDEITPVKLFWLRKDAERNVADEHYEYKIQTVFNEWLKLHGLNDVKLIQDFSAKILRSELAAECSATRPDTPVLELINAIKEKRVLAISDFYHSSESLSVILEYHGLRNYFDCIYVSCDWMKTKRTGSLYDLVLEKEKIHPKKIIHLGDNPHADFERATEKGIRAHLYQNLEEKDRAEKLKSAFESHASGNPKLHYKNIFHLLDYYRHLSATGSMANVTDLTIAGTLLSPIVVGFVLFCMQTAIRRHCSRIFFFAREGIFFKLIYEELVRLDVFDLGQYPQPEILFVSRRATFAASLSDLSIDEMMRMWNMYSTQSVVAMARSLNLDVKSVTSIAHKHGIDPNAPIQYPWQDEPFKAFFFSPEFQEYAVPRLAQQRTRLLRHLEKAGFEPLADIDRVVVDIGWRGTIQDNISYMVQGNIHGVYLALKSYLNRQPLNSSKSAYLSDDNCSEHFDLGDVAALEFIFNAPGGSCIGYERDGAPKKEVLSGEERVINDQVAAIQAGLLKGATELGQYIRNHGLIAEDIIPLCRRVVNCYLNSPPTCIADAFQALEHNETFGTGGADHMGLDIDMAKIGELSGAALHNTLNRLRDKQRWSASIFNTRQLKDLFANFRTNQTLNIPCSGASQGVFSIIRPESLRDIVSLIAPEPLSGSGGHRTIYNFAKGLAREGFNVHVMLEGVNNDLWFAEQELANHDITIHKAWCPSVKSRVAVATIAHSAKYVHEFFSGSIGAYFVQDYEAEFNPINDRYILGQNSYAQGLNPICIGNWLPHVLKKQFGISAAYGGLGVDTNIYHLLPDVNKKDMVAFLYQPEKSRRLPEICIEALRIVKQQRPQTKIVLYGADNQAKLPFDAIQLGLIHDLSHLNRIYNEASVGLCLSPTNPSRIPIEFMAAGCVPVDLYRYNNFFDNSTGTAVLAYQSSASIAEAILHLLDNPEECEARRFKGINYAKERTIDWEVDAVVNAIRWLFCEGNFDRIQTPECSYHQEPVIAVSDRNRQTINYCKWQRALAI